MRIKIDIYTYSFFVTTCYDNDSVLIYEYAKRLAVFGEAFNRRTRRKEIKLEAIYATKSFDGREFGFLLSELDALKRFLSIKNISEKEIEILKHKHVEGADAKIVLEDGVKPRDKEQEDVIKFLTSTPDKSSLVLPLRTGGGKTATTLMALAHYKKRTALLMGASHIKTWIKSIDWVLGLYPADVYVIQGRKSLLKAIKLKRDDEFNYPLVFMSISTIRSFIKDYSKDGLTLDGVTPIELYTFLDIGMRVIDETHENLHAIVTSTIHTNVKRTIYLSATIESENRFIRDIYGKIFPIQNTFIDGKTNKHATAINYIYSINDMQKVKFKGFKGYSHVLFEQSILEDTGLLNRYMGLIKRCIDDYHFDDFKEGQKLLIFCATVEFCEELSVYLNIKYSDKDLIISPYTNKDGVDNLYKSDIIISTPGSAGTGADIPKLKTAIATIAISSIKRNRQMLGRIRELKDYKGVTPKYLYLTCSSIQTHIDYSYRKLELFKNHTKEQRTVNSGISI